MTYIPNLTHLKDVAEFPEAHKDAINTLLPSAERSVPPSSIGNTLTYDAGVGRW